MNAERTTTAVVLEQGGTALRPLPLRRLRQGEVLLRVRAAGLCGTDLFKLRHHDGAATVLGHEVVGEVIETAGRCRFERGDLVVAAHHVACGVCALCRGGSETQCDGFRENLLDPGGFCTHTILARRAVDHAAYLLDDALDPLAAVFLEPTACVLRALERGGLEHGILSLEPPAPDSVRVVVQGAGSMGLLHLLVIRALGLHAEIVIAEPDPARRRLAERLGADRTVWPPPTGLDADVVFDTVGGGAALRQAIELARRGGTVVLFAHADDDSDAALPFNRLFRSEQRIVASYSGSAREQGLAFQLLSSGALDPRTLVTHELPLDAFDIGVEHCRAGRALKVVFRPHYEAAPARPMALPATA